MANSVDPDQMPHSALSDLGLHCLGLSVLIFSVITVYIPSMYDVYIALDKRICHINADHLMRPLKPLFWRKFF